MAVRLAALLPRAVIVALVWILGTAAFTLAADNTIVGPSTPDPTAGVAAAQTELLVPSVSGQAYVFAKGILEDSGFAWRVVGSVHGYSSNRVITQSPAAGTRVVDTGAPTVTSGSCAAPTRELGRPVDVSPYRGTAIRLAGLASGDHSRGRSRKPRSLLPSRRQARRQAEAGRQAEAEVEDRRQARARRPPAFTLAGAPKEPLDEITLPARALRLQRWARQPAEDQRNVRHWLYQHAWIVTGAKFGWWHGAQALETLIASTEQRRAAVGDRRQEPGGRQRRARPRSAAGAR